VQTKGSEKLLKLQSSVTDIGYKIPMRRASMDEEQDEGLQILRKQEAMS